jgi:hypothetical protein
MLETTIRRGEPAARGRSAIGELRSRVATVSLIRFQSPGAKKTPIAIAVATVAP